MDEYQQWSKELQAAYHRNGSVSILNSYAGSVALCRSCDPVVCTNIMQCFKEAGSSAQQPHYLNMLALVEYRAGKYKTALKRCELGIKKNQKTNAPLDWIIAELCLVNYRI